MRVPNRTAYEMISLNLGDITERLHNATRVLTTGKRINSLSDDPIGLAQCLNIKSSLLNLGQLERNISMGRTWVNAGETSLTSTKDLVSEAKTLSLQMANGSVNATQRRQAAEQVDGYLRQILSLANTQVNGQLIFAGTKTHATPFAFDDETSPTQVDYSGNDTAFSVNIGKDTTVAVGRDGEEVFWDQEITIDSSNNAIDFTEEVLHKPSNVRAGAGIQLYDVTVTVNDYDEWIQATPSSGDASLWLRWDGNNSWDVFNDAGYDLPSSISGNASGVSIDLDGDSNTEITITLADPAAAEGAWVKFDIVASKPTLAATIAEGTYTPAELATAAQTAMNAASAASGHDITYEVSYDASTKKYTFKDNGAHPAFFGFELLWNTGENVGNCVGPDMGFDVADVTCPCSTSDSDVVIFTMDNTNNQIIFTELPEGGVASAALAATIANGSYTDPDVLRTAIATAMETASVNNINYAVFYDKTNRKFIIQEDGATLNQLDITWTGSSAGTVLGFTADDSVIVPIGDNAVGGAFLINNANDKIDFQEVHQTEGTSNQLSATIASGLYTGNSLATAVESAMEAASLASGNSIDYSVSHNGDGTNRFVIKENGAYLNELRLLWNSGTNSGTSAGGALGFIADDSVEFSISDELRDGYVTINFDTNDKIDFKELDKAGNLTSELTATIATGTYSDLTALATAIETAMETASTASGNDIDYEVSYDRATNRFTIEENGTDLDQLQVLWNTGSNCPVVDGGTGRNAASVLGYDNENDLVTFPKSTNEVEWGIFKTLIDLKGYLDANDVDGISRSMSRLDSHFTHFTTTISDTGQKEVRLDIKQSIISDLDLSYQERKSNLEDADMIKAIMDLKALETSYQAALAASAKVMQMSLMDYL